MAFGQFTSALCRKPVISFSGLWEFHWWHVAFPERLSHIGNSTHSGHGRRLGFGLHGGAIVFQARSLYYNEAS